MALSFATMDCGGMLNAGWDESDGQLSGAGGSAGWGESDGQLSGAGGSAGWGESDGQLSGAGGSAGWDESDGQLSGAAGSSGSASDDFRDELPLREDSPIVICNDGHVDNWQGEYAILLANTDGPPLAGIIINDSWPWPELGENMAGWEQMVTAARDSGLTGIPDPVASSGPVLSRPSDGQIDSTVPNRSDGAQFILDASERLAEPERPLVVVTGGRLTDVADAYLMDHTLPDRVVVVSSLGSVTSDGGEMGIPNGEMDVWADVIVAQRFRYVQVSTFYEQDGDVPPDLLSLLPENPFTAWVKAKQPEVWETDVAADQVAVLTVAMSDFVTAVTQVQQAGESSEGLPLLSSSSEGSAWLVTEVDGSIATARMRAMLLDPATFGAE